MKLYDLSRAPNPRRVRIFLAEKGLDVPREPVDLVARAHRAEAFLEKNPLGQIPVLELDDGSFLSESVAICRYFEALHPEPRLFGESAREQGEVEMWNRRVELVLLQAVGMVWVHGSPLTAHLLRQIPENVAPNRKRAAHFFELLEHSLGGRPFVAGDRFSIADITALCTIDFARIVEIAPDPGLAAIARWHASVSSRPSARA